MFHRRITTRRLKNLMQVLGRLLLLVCFSFTTTGLPLDLFGSAHSGCHCGDQLRQARRCCCAKAAADGCRQQRKVKSCCQAKQKASCCAGKSSATACKKSADQNVVTALCGCGTQSPGGILLNSEPRLPAARTRIDGAVSLHALILSSSLPFESHVILPETPPPESRLKLNQI